MPTSRILAVSDVRIRDLSISLQAGECRDIDYALAKGSKDLRRAVDAGHVRLRRVERHMNPKKPSPIATPAPVRVPALGVLLQSSQGIRQIPPLAPLTVPTPPAHSPPLTPAPAATAHLEAMIQDLKDQVAAIHERIPGDVYGRIEEVIKDALKSLPVRVADSTSTDKAEEAPVFVPRDLGKTEGEARLSFKEEASGDEGVQDAVSTLKKMRRK